MPSPFPGMDPWLESPGVFPDLHNSFIAYLREAMNAVLPPPYFAAINTRIVIEGGGERPVEPDIDVLVPVNFQHPPGGGTAVAAEEFASIMVHVPLEEMTEWFVEVRTGEDDADLVTAVEVLSRKNKTPGRNGRDMYSQKQEELVERGVSLVEIDLLRAGRHSTAVPLGHARAAAGRFDYHVCVYRATRHEQFEVFPIQMTHRLPKIAIPLRPGEPEAVVELQPVLDRVYDAGQFTRRIRYTAPPDPPLTPAQAEWAAGVLQTKNLVPNTLTPTPAEKI